MGIEGVESVEEEEDDEGAEGNAVEPLSWLVGSTVMEGTDGKAEEERKLSVGLRGVEAVKSEEPLTPEPS